MHRFYSFLAGLFVLSSLSVCVCAQLPSPTPTVTLDMRQVSLLDILLELEKQTGIFFSYESTLLQDYPKVSLTACDESLSYCLKRLFTDLPVVYRLTGQNVILKRKPQLFTVSGFVRDSVSYESLISAAVLERISGKGTVSNSYGFYSITLPAGKVSLYSSYVGYQAKETTFELARDTLVDLLLLSHSALQEVVVTGKSRHSELGSTQLGMTTLTAKEISRLPAILGEADLIKALQHMPGVAMGTEALSGLYVRGGNVDENLILIDGNPVYQMGHLGGLFSAFHPDAVKLAGFYKGSFPARFGGRLSSVVDIRTKDGDLFNYHGSASIGLISGKFNLEGPIVKGRTSFHLAVRRTWLDALTAPAQAIMNARNKDEKTNFRYAFHDINAKINHLFSDRSRLWVSFYSGEDVLKLNYTDDQSSDPNSPNLYSERFRLRWGNLISSVNWNYVFNNKLFANFSGVYSRYHSNALYRSSNAEGKGEEQEWLKENLEDRLSKSWIQDIGYRIDFDYMPHSAHHVRLGSDYLFHTFRPEFSTQMLLNKDSIFRPREDIIFADARTYGHELAVYAEDDWTVSSRVRINAGLRLASFFTGGTNYTSLQPRFSIRYRLRKDLSLKASYAVMNQYVHLLSETYASLPTDLWVPVTDKVRPMSSNMVSAGIYYRLLDRLDCSLEGYYKVMNHQIEYKDKGNFIPSFSSWEQQIEEGSGRGYGLEVMVKKNAGKLSGWIGYTLAWADRHFPGLNKGKRFPFKYDNRHKLNIVGTYQFNEKVELTASWMYSSGNKTTLALEEYTFGFIPEYENPDKVGGVSGYYSYSEGRNTVSMPAYHRMDLGVNIYRPKKKGRMGIWNFSLYNVYSRMNAFMLTVRTNRLEQPDGTYKYLTKVKTLGLLPVIPSFSYTYKF